jgi:hypothetical protein
MLGLRVRSCGDPSTDPTGHGGLATMTWSTGLLGFTAGLLIAMVTAPVGVSGAVFLLPVQLSVLHVPSPAVTPTNLLFNMCPGRARCCATAATDTSTVR